MSETDEEQFMLKKYDLSNPCQRFIDEDEFNRIVRAKGILLSLASIETLYIRVLLAFEEFEVFSFKNAIGGYIFQSMGYSNSADSRVRANLKAVNFLNALIAFRDQFPETGNFYSGADCKSQFRQNWNETQKISIEFSFCRHLRNFAQHASEPIETSGQSTSWIEDGEIRETTWSWNADVEAVCSDCTKKKKMSQSDADRFRGAFGRRCDVSLLFRKVISDLGEIHDKARRSLENDFSTAKLHIMRSLDSIHTDGEQVPMARVLKLKAGMEVEKIDLFSELVDRAQMLRSSLILRNVHNHYLSNRVRGSG
tara:strand:- start:396 stop:1325 length:930 start_codon:yes stop_codon:yes gene_type:complete